MTTPAQPKPARHHTGPQLKRRFIIGLATLSGLGTLAIPLAPSKVRATDCADINIIFARGSGEQLNDVSYQAFRSALEPYLADFNYQFYELGSNSYGGYQYDAISVGFDNAEHLFTTIGAKISAGNSYKFGASVNQGVNELKSYITQVISSCPNTKFALAGYSQGAMVISKTLRSLSASHIASVATIADPKLYLPEGAGQSPAACSDTSSLSEYRAYVPDCYAHEGIFNGYKPYLPNSNYSGKISTYCNYHDLICSNRINWDDIMSPHTSYVSDGRYYDVAESMASQIYDALDQEFISQDTKSTHDLAILIDTTSSMNYFIKKYKQGLIDLTTNVIANGGRVALYEYRDLASNFRPVLHCNFDECNIDVITSTLDNLQPAGGDDFNESLLSASLTALNTLRWQVGANKTILAVTDAGFHSPDLDGATLSQVIARSLEIDPVHFYIITPETTDEGLQQLASGTGGQISSSFSEISSVIQDIAPEGTVFDDGLGQQTSSTTNPTFTREDGSLNLTFDTDAYRNLLIVNDSVIGFTDQTTLRIDELDFTRDNEIVLIPFSAAGTRGTALTIDLAAQVPTNFTPTTAESIPAIGTPSSGFAKNHN